MPATPATRAGSGRPWQLKGFCQGGHRERPPHHSGSNSPQASPTPFAPFLPGWCPSDQQLSSLGTLTAKTGTSWLVVSLPEPGKARPHCGHCNPLLAAWLVYQCGAPFTGNSPSVELNFWGVQEDSSLGPTRLRTRPWTGISLPSFMPSCEDYTIHAPPH